MWGLYFVVRGGVVGGGECGEVGVCGVMGGYNLGGIVWGGVRVGVLGVEGE